MQNFKSSVKLCLTFQKSFIIDFSVINYEFLCCLLTCELYLIIHFTTGIFTQLIHYSIIIIITAATLAHFNNF